MRFGGHETFAVRETWLSKGLILIDKLPGAFGDPLVADLLGVGANMAKSIRHWLQITGLIGGAGKGGTYISPLGGLILEHDRAMILPGTWWALHVNLCSQDREAIAWHWLFSRFAQDHRFDRIQCAEALSRHLASEGQRMPTPRTIAADVACLLASYARPLPPAAEEPEEAADCPFRQLGLVAHHRETDTYKVDRGPKAVPPELLCYALSVAFLDERGTVGGIDVPVREAFSRAGGPGRVLALSGEAFSEAVAGAEQTLGPVSIRSEMVGSDRTIWLAPKPPLEWLESYYRRAGR